MPHREEGGVERFAPALTESAGKAAVWMMRIHRALLIAAEGRAREAKSVAVRCNEELQAAECLANHYREVLEGLKRAAIENGLCSCTWDLDEEHPDFGNEDAEEPLKVISPDPNCVVHASELDPDSSGEGSW